MKNLIIIGARGFGREVYYLATQCSGYNTEWAIKGFLDDNSNALDGYNYDAPILSSVEDYVVGKGDVFVCALGDVPGKKKYVSIIKHKGGSFVTLIHPLSVIHLNVTLGEGVLIFPYSGISNDVQIGDFVTIQGYTSMGHDCRVGDWCHINGYTSLGGYVTLEAEVTVHTKASIIPRVVVGKGATVGVGSVVLKNVKADTTVFGNPAKAIF